MKPLNNKRIWTGEDKERAMALATRGVLHKIIARELGRSEDAVTIFLSKIGFEKPGRRRLSHTSVTVRLKEEVVQEARRVAGRQGIPAHIWITRALQAAIEQAKNA